MLRKTAGWLVALCLVGGLVCGTAPAAVDKATLDKVFAELPKYDWGASREALNQIDDAIIQSHGDAAARKDLEQRLTAVLKGEATRAAKQYVCRKLAVAGTAACVPAVAPLLTDAELSHMGRYALERIGGPEAAKAIRDAAGKVSGKLKVGMINSLGAREDAESVSVLVPLLKDADKDVAAAAAAALGRIGAKEAAGPLAAFLASAPKELQTAAVDASLDFAQRLAKKGDKDEAGKIYDKLYAESQPARIRRAALQGLAMVRPEQTTPLILAALGSDDAGFRGLAANMIKDMPGAETTRSFAAALPKLPAAGQVALLEALEARKDPAAHDAVVAAAKSDQPEVKAAALSALGAVGGAADVGMLAKGAAADAGEAGKAAAASLTRLRGAEVNRTVAAALGAADAKTKVVLLNALAGRAAAECAAEIQKQAKDADPEVRAAAIDALGVLGDEKQVSALVTMLKATQDAGDRDAIEKALTNICGRVREKAVPDLLGGIQGSQADAHVVLLNALGRAGGARALQAVLTDTKNTDGKVSDGAIRVLANWPDQAALKPLMDLASSAASEVHQILALRGVVRLARLKEVPDGERMATLAAAMKLAKKPAEKKLVLGALGELPTLEALKMVSEYVGDAQLAEEAGSAAVKLVEAVGAKDRDLARATLEQVIQNVKNARTKQDAEKLLGRTPPSKKKK